MAIEIRELVIKTTVKDKIPAGDDNLSVGKTSQEIINCCVEEVLKILKREKER